MKGLETLNEKNHIVILGYRKGETEQLVEEIIGDKSRGAIRSIVLCSSTTEENPMPDKIRFVKGELTTDDVLSRAAVKEASAIIVHGHDDNQTLLAAIAASFINKTAHIVAYVNNPDNKKHLERIDPRIECVVPVHVPLMAQSMHNPGATRVFDALLSSRIDDGVFKIDVPDIGKEWEFGNLLEAFKRKYGALIIAISSSPKSYSVDLNPAREVKVKGGMAIFYVAKGWLSEINWKEI